MADSNEEFLYAAVNIYNRREIVETILLIPAWFSSLLLVPSLRPSIICEIVTSVALHEILRGQTEVKCLLTIRVVWWWSSAARLPETSTSNEYRAWQQQLRMRE
jgi:hypothetical protein